MSLIEGSVTLLLQMNHEQWGTTLLITHPIPGEIGANKTNHSQPTESILQAEELGRTTHWLIQMITRCPSHLTFSSTNASSSINVIMLIHFVERLRFTLNDAKHLVLFMSETFRNWYCLNAYMSKTSNKMKHDTLQQTLTQSTCKRFLQE
jgi:hypothetical protein